MYDKLTDASVIFALEIYNFAKIYASRFHGAQLNEKSVSSWSPLKNACEKIAETRSANRIPLCTLNARRKELREARNSRADGRRAQGRCNFSGSVQIEISTRNADKIQ